MSEFLGDMRVSAFPEADEVFSESPTPYLRYEDGILMQKWVRTDRYGAVLLEDFRRVENLKVSTDPLDPKEVMKHIPSESEVFASYEKDTKQVLSTQETQGVRLALHYTKKKIIAAIHASLDAEESKK